MVYGEPEHERYARVLFYAVVLAVGYLAFQVVAPFLAAMAWAAVFAMVLSPLNASLERRLGATGSASATTVVAFLLIVVPSVLVLTTLAREVTATIESLRRSGYAVATPAQLQEYWADLTARAPVALPEDLATMVGGFVERIASYIASRASGVLQNVVAAVFQLFVMLFGLFFFLRDRHKVVVGVRELLPFSPQRRDRIIQQTYDLVVATVGSTFAVAVVQGTLTGLVLGLLGFPAPVFWGVMTSFVSVIPAVGSGLVWVPAAIWLFASGEIAKGIVLVAVGTLVIGMADNVLRPILLSGRTTMHGLLVFLSLMGGVGAFGFIGLIVGPVVVAAAATLLEAVVPPSEAVATAASDGDPPSPPPAPAA